jgi:hypothetical protein
MIMKNRLKNRNGWPVDGVLEMYREDWSREDVVFHGEIAKLFSACRDALKRRSTRGLKGAEKRMRASALEVVDRKLACLQVDHYLRSRDVERIIRQRDGGPAGDSHQRPLQSPTGSSGTNLASR